MRGPGKVGRWDVGVIGAADRRHVPNRVADRPLSAAVRIRAVRTVDIEYHPLAQLGLYITRIVLT